MRNRNAIEFLGIWETIYNPDFKPLEFEGFKKQAGLNSFVMTPKKWIETTNAIGITCGGNGDRAFPTPHGKISCCRAMVGHTTILHQVFYQSVFTIGF